ncbi:MAG: ABC transporter permease [Verrucomicrobia bacterium]|nr:MAG: ABC transporter permease [Verrucomicrobiota bacterium]
MSWPLYLALKQLFPTGRRFPFFTFISILGVALGVTLLIVSISVMGGFGREIRNMIVNTQGEVQVRTFGLMNDPQAVMAAMQTVPDVVASTPFAEGVVLLQFQNKPAFPGIQGIDLERVEAVVPLAKYVQPVSALDDLDDDRVILSSQLAYTLGARLGSKVSVFSPLLLEKLKSDEILMPRELEVCGIFEIGHQQLDSSVVLVTLRTMQELYGLGGAVHGVNVKIAPNADPDRVAREINRALPEDGLARSWMDANQEFLFILQLEKNMIFFLLLFIIVVAAFSVASSLLIAVVRKTREIGLLGALGATPQQVAACFCYQGILIGTGGTALGLVLGFTVVHFRNELVAAFTRLTGSEEALARFYQFSQLPAHLAGKDLLIIVASALLVSTLAGLLPAWRAARLKPVEALRAE